MADAATVRSVLRENGIEVPTKGKLAAEHWAEYDRLTGIPPTSPGEPDEGGGDVTTADFGAEADAGPPVAAEVAPRRPTRKRQPKKPLIDRLRGTPQPAAVKRGAARKAAAKRIPVDRFISDLYEAGGRIVEQIGMGPTGRCLAWQAPLAGIIAEDKVRGTFVDPALQWAAKAEDAGRAAFGMVGLPVGVTLLHAAQGIPDPKERAMREAILIPVIREALVINMQLAGERMEEMLARQVEREPLYAKADELIAGFFAGMGGPPPQPEQPTPEMATA